jgi:hypothetical protein
MPKRPELIPALASAAQLAARVPPHIAKLFFTDAAVGAVESGFAARATECVTRIFDRLFQPDFAARIAATMTERI